MNPNASMTKKRIAIVAFGLESSTFTPLRATYSSFTIRRDNFCSPALLKTFADAEIEAQPVMLISGTPNGLVPIEDFRLLENEIFTRLKELGNFDGILLSMHGSMLLSDLSHGELHFLQRLRHELGAEIPISVRLDLHGNVPDGFVELCDAVTALRTAPHRDNIETILRAAHFLIRLLREKAKPACVQCRLPLLMPGEWAVTEREPAQSLYADLARIETEDSRIWSASLMVGFAWADVSWAGASVIVCATTREAALATAHELARKFWESRHAFGYEGEHYATAEALRIAQASTERPLFLMESGDNITAGSTGTDGNLLLSLIDAHFESSLYLQFFDREFCERHQSTAAGSSVSVRICHGPQLSDNRELEGRLQGVFHWQGVICCKVQIQGIDAVFTSRRIPISEAEQLSALAIDLSQYCYVFCKLGYLLPHLHDLAPRFINILTPGPTSPDIFQFNYQRLRRPIFPLDQDTPIPEFLK